MSLGDLFSLHSVAWLVGVLVLLRFALFVATLVWKRFLRPATNLAKYGAKTGAWAVVTGASDGVGKAYALELAKRGFNVCLISRTKSKLDDLAKEIEGKYKVKTEVIPLDFSSASSSDYDNIKEKLSRYGQIGILVNNVGVSYSHPMLYLDLPKQAEDDMLNINIKALTEMTRVVLPFMVAKKRGAIINLSSFAGTIPVPLLSVYSGSKAYVDFYSQALALEYKKSGIDVLSIPPGMIVSNMSKVRRPNTLAGICMPDVVVKGSLAVLGQEIHWNPFWMHALMEWVGRVAPRNMMLEKIMATNWDVNKRALRKLTEEQKGGSKKQQ